MFHSKFQDARPRSGVKLDERAQQALEAWSHEPEMLKRNDFTHRLIDTHYKRGVFDKFKNDKPAGSSRTIFELYSEYLRLWRAVRQGGGEVHEIDNFALPRIAFKSRRKQKMLARDGWIPQQHLGPPNSFPLKSNMKYYALKTAAPAGTYQVDLMMFETFAYYVFVESNSRWLYVAPANSYSPDWGIGTRNHENHGGMERLTFHVLGPAKAAISIEDYARALDAFLGVVGNCHHLRGDAQAAFTGHNPIIEDIYRRAGIVFEPVRRIVLQAKGKSEPYHASLGIIDRITRTLRDMLYNIGVNDPTFPIMQAMADQYNAAPHETLTHYSPGFPVSPAMAHEDQDLQFYITRRICQENALTTHRQDYKLAPGQRVAVYNPANKFDKRRSRVLPEVFEVLGFKDGAFGARGLVSDNVLILPRTAFKPEPLQRDE